MSTVVAAPPGKKKRLRKAIAGAAVALLIFLGVAALYLNSDSFRKSVRNKVVAQLEHMTGGKVELQSLDWKWTSLHLEARGLTIHGLESHAEAPYVHADRIGVSVKIVSLFSRQIALSNVSVDHPTVHIIIYPDGSTNQPAPRKQEAGAASSPERLFDLGITHLEVSNGMLLLNQEQIPFALTGDRLSAGISYSPNEKGYETNLSMSLASAKWRNIDARRGDIDIQLLLRTNEADIRSLRIASQGSTLQAGGTLENYNQPEVQLQYAASLDLADAGKLSGTPELRGGRADLKGTLDYRSSRYLTRGNINVKKLEWKNSELHVSDVDGAAAYTLDRDKFSLSKLTSRILGGTANGGLQVSNWNSSGQSPRARPQKGALNLQLSGVEANRLANAAAEPGIPIRKLEPVGSISGTVKTTWSGSSQPAVAEMNLEVNPPQNPAPQQMPLTGQLHAAFRGDSHVLDVAALSLATRAIRVNATGELGSDKAQAKVSVNCTSLSEIRPMLAALSPGTRIPVVIEGRASFNGSISGKFNAPSIRGRLNLENFDTETSPLQVLEATAVPPLRAQQVQRIHWDSLVGDLSYSPSNIALKNGVLHRGKANATFSTSVALRQGRVDENTSAISLALHLQDAPVEELEPLLGLGYPVTGILATDLNVTGTPANPQGRGSVQINKLTAYGEPFRVFRSQVQIAANTIQLRDIFLAHNGAYLTGNFSHDFAANYSEFDLTGQNIDLASMHLFELPRLTIAGKAAFHLTGSGREDAPVLNGQLDLDDLVLNRETVGAMKITAETHGSDMKLQGRSQFEGSSLNMDGDIQLRGDWPGQMKLKFANLDFDPLIRAYFQGQITGHSSIAGAIDIHGPFRRPRDLVISGEADQLSAELEHIKLHNDGPVHFSMDTEYARMDQFHLIGENTDAYVQGGMRLSSDHSLDLRTRGRVDLRLLQGYNPNIIAYGPANFTVNVGGTLAHPQMSGQVDLVDAGISFLDLPNGLSHINGTLVFAQDRIRIQKLTAQTGGGELNVGGFLAYRNGLYFDLTATGRDVRLRYPPGVSASADATLRYTGSAKASLLTGDVTVTRFGMNPNFDFANYLAQNRKAPALSTLNPFLDNLRLDVHITSTPELRVETSLAKLSGDLDLHLRGTAARPALLGRVNIAEGDIFFQGTKYRLERGDISFTNPVTIEPVINMEMSARVQDYDITIGLHGTVAAGKSLSMTYRSDPPLSNADIIALLAFGRTRSQGLYAASQPGPAGNDSSSASNAILGQALNATFSDRVQRLFGASRVKIDPQFIGSENNPSARVTIEQTINNNITLTYITSLTQSAETVVQVEYNINKNVSIVAVRDENGVLGFDVHIRRRRK
ncbi:MAG TPA: translocation/assembly module TamB domain-containing protein [Candidatus Angelobacter sp.]|nr:translocation/assembly module TamB domain-containing protein [Candidatus Angelobacter sp.]